MRWCLLKTSNPFVKGDFCSPNPDSKAKWMADYRHLRGVQCKVVDVTSDYVIWGDPCYGLRKWHYSNLVKMNKHLSLENV